MSSGSFWQTEVRCPFYRHDDGRNRITCEGIVDDSSLALHFFKRLDFHKQMEVFCTGKYENCEICRMLNEYKYGD